MILGLTICGANCLLSADYKSASKIIARTGQAMPGKGDVIVTTRSGGEGSCTVQFKSVKVVPGRMQYNIIIKWLNAVLLSDNCCSMLGPVSNLVFFMHLTIYLFILHLTFLLIERYVMSNNTSSNRRLKIAFKFW